MQLVIYAVVAASTDNEAVAAGNPVFNREVGSGPHSCAVFDDFVPLAAEATSVAGKARCGECPTPAPIDSDDGPDLLERGWQATKEAFERTLEGVNETRDERSVEEIRRDEDLPRPAFHQIGADDGPTVVLSTVWTDLDRLFEPGDCLDSTTSNALGRLSWLGFFCDDERDDLSTAHPSNALGARGGFAVVRTTAGGRLSSSAHG